MALIANEAALKAFIKAGGVPYYLGADGQSHVYLPGISDLPSGTPIYDMPPAPVVVAPVVAPPYVPPPSYQTSPTLPGGSSAANPAATGGNPPPEVTVTGEYGNPTPSLPPSTIPPPTQPVTVAQGGSGESVAPVGVSLASIVTPDELTKLLGQLADAYIPEKPTTTTVTGPEQYNDGANAAAAWQALSKSVTNDIPNMMDKLTALASASL